MWGLVGRRSESKLGEDPRVNSEIYRRKLQPFTESSTFRSLKVLITSPERENQERERERQRLSDRNREREITYPVIKSFDKQNINIF